MSFITVEDKAMWTGRLSGSVKYISPNSHWYTKLDDWQWISISGFVRARFGFEEDRL